MERFFRSRFAVVSFDTEPAGWASPSRATSPSASAPKLELRARQEMLDLAQTAARAVAFDWYIGARESENRWSPELEAMYGLEPGTLDLETLDKTYRAGRSSSIPTTGRR